MAALERAEALGLVDREVEGALVLLHRGQAKDIADARSHLAWAYRETHQRGYAEAANIASVFTQLGLDPNRLDYDP